MPGNTFGQLFCLTSWGESHGAAMGGVVDGIPPGIELPVEEIQLALDRRRPGYKRFTSPRQEGDHIEILAGIFAGKTLGTPISFLIRNQDSRPEEYESYRHVLRPGHADYTYFKKYGLRDHRGGGRASARETVVRVAGGAIATKLLKTFLPNFALMGALVQVGPLAIDRSRWSDSAIPGNDFFCPDPLMVLQWESLLKRAQSEQRSLGALVEVRACGIPAGLGEPVYSRLDADLAQGLMGINAVKGVEIGDGFACVDAPQGFDEIISPGTFLSNRAGGILGGISTGQEIICRLAIKPTSSTPTPRRTINETGEEVIIPIKGRHDPCIGIRAVPVAEAMVALVLADHWLRWRGQCG